jgi:hypothetical protein
MIGTGISMLAGQERLAGGSQLALMVPDGKMSTMEIIIQMTTQQNSCNNKTNNLIICCWVDCANRTFSFRDEAEALFLCKAQCRLT